MFTLLAETRPGITVFVALLINFITKLRDVSIMSIVEVSLVRNVISRIFSKVLPLQYESSNIHNYIFARNVLVCSYWQVFRLKEYVICTSEFLLRKSCRVFAGVSSNINSRKNVETIEFTIDI